MRAIVGFQEGVATQNQDAASAEFSSREDRGMDTDWTLRKRGFLKD